MFSSFHLGFSTRKTVAETCESSAFANCQGNNFIPKEDAKSPRLFFFLKEKEKWYSRSICTAVGLERFCWEQQDYCNLGQQGALLFTQVTTLGFDLHLIFHHIMPQKFTAVCFSVIEIINDPFFRTISLTNTSVFLVSWVIICQKRVPGNPIPL